MYNFLGGKAFRLDENGGVHQLNFLFVGWNYQFTTIRPLTKIIWRRVFKIGTRA
jgi:hypothetical protein